MTTPNINAPKRSFFQDRKMWFWSAAGFGIVTLILLVIFLQGLTSTTAYYVLNRDVAARTLITPDMLTEVVTSSGGQPPTALDIADIDTGEVYSKVALGAGDILSTSTAGDLLPLRDGIPEEYVIASFTATPNNSAGGNVTRGDYVDIFYVQSGEQAQLIFQRVLIVEASADLSSGGDETVTATEDTATAPYRVGIPSLYTVGLTQQDAAKLALASTGSLYLVLSSATSVENGIENGTGLGVSIEDLLTGEVGDSGAGTDSSFGTNPEVGTTDGEGTTETPSEEPLPEESFETGDGEVDVPPTGEAPQ